MRIFIPSRGRADRQTTLELIPRSHDVTIVVPLNEVEAYANRWPVRAHVVGMNYAHIGEKRQKILDIVAAGAERAPDAKILMLDDDLKFRCRVGGRFVSASDESVGRMIDTIEKKLDEYAHVGVTDEYMCQTRPVGFYEGGRYSQVLAYNLDLWPEKFRYRLAINEEHDMNLQLTASGLPPCVLTDWTKGSKFYAAGGCSAWRTPEVQRENVEKFAKMWPGVVTIVEKKSGFPDVRVQWRKAGPCES